jgi:hypothetical protein
MLRVSKERGKTVSIKIEAREVTPGMVIANPSAFAVKGCFGPVSFEVKAVSTVVRTRRVVIEGGGHRLTLAPNRSIMVR